ncbi:MAG: hypothetical protein ACK5L5_02755 [Bacteroidales bacterium]
MDIKIFKKIFTDSVQNSISEQGYVYKKSKEVFENIDDKHFLSIYIYMYKRSTFIEIETKVFYGNKGITKELKKDEIKFPYEYFCGGGIKFISEYYFKNEFPEKHSNLIFMFDEDPNYIVNDWLKYYNSIIVPFFEDCKSPKLLNEMVNNIAIYKVGLNATYKTRVFYSYYVGKQADLTEVELLKLANQYEQELKSWGDDCDYFEEYERLKSKLFEKSS